jgi:hypothetical protein
MSAVMKYMLRYVTEKAVLNREKSDYSARQGKVDNRFS